MREHPSLVNVNIGPFPNVDVVADAHHLPYADASVDAIFCEAVLEHLAQPHEAVKEMFRVCRSGASVYANTPFMQAYHGYPNHFQNFTLSGHEQLFANAGFHVRESGTAVGPVFTLFDLGARFISEYSPRPFRPILLAGVARAPVPPAPAEPAAGQPAERVRPRLDDVRRCAKAVSTRRGGARDTPRQPDAISDRRRVLLTLPEHHPLHLPRQRPRKRLDELDPPRVLVRCDPVLHVLLELGDQPVSRADAV